METQSDGNRDMATMKDLRQHLESRLDTLHNAQLDLISSLQTQIPDIVSSLDLSLKVVSAFNGRPFTPLPTLLPNPNPNSNPKRSTPPPPESLPDTPENRSVRDPKPSNSKNQQPKRSPEASIRRSDSEKFMIDESGSPLSVVRSMVAVCLLERVPFTPIDSSTVLRKLENDQNATAGEKAALRELGGESGAILAVEMALRSMAEDNGGVELEEFVVSGKSRVMVMGIDRTRLVKELPESKQYQQKDSNSSNEGNQMQQGMGSGSEVSGGVF
ncbi:N6-adenosine-methyltransferase MT-A70-like [Camellia lanceoleosa]|uniref:N6-adenosine-methyltransferase MT-A70-like n=1 Tax=Camellia lanceoleosa TaxID=1840588 RepID=A0ACC0HA59_9ERIC|nr:N6-adenosine-methyltransferase MT-A70-like [Camellia lanceoleosa]